jgi:STE24 endopeptidase
VRHAPAVFNAVDAIVFTAIFVVAWAASLMVRLWLARRQVAHVTANRDAVPSAFSGTIGLAAHRKAADYTIAKQHLGIVETLADAVVLLGMTLGGGLALLLRWTEALPLIAIWRDVLLLGGVALVGGIVGLPFSWYRTFRLEARFGFNHTTLRLWLIDLAKALAVGIALGLPVTLAILWLMARAGPLWWLWAWLVWFGFQLLMLFLYPTVIAPLFNRFTPLPAGAARERIEHLLSRCGFHVAGLFVMDGSKRSAHGNAYFTGFGKARRIVFFDTLLTRLVPDEIEAILAHELGHYKLRHVIKRIAWSAVLSLGFLALLAWLADSDWFYAGLGIPADLLGAAHLRPGVALALFLLALPVFVFILSPLAARYSRRHEFEADAFAARNASASALVSALVKLYEDNAATLTPDPVHSAFYDSHPPAAIRVARLQAAAGASA